MTSVCMKRFVIESCSKYGNLWFQKKQGHLYTLKRAYNLDVKIPDIAKKLLKDAFRLQRTDVSNLEEMTSVVELGANLPIEAKMSACRW